MEEEEEVRARVIVSIIFLKKWGCSRFQKLGLLFAIDPSNDGIDMFSGSQVALRLKDNLQKWHYVSPQCIEVAMVASICKLIWQKQTQS